LITNAKTAVICPNEVSSSVKNPPDANDAIDQNDKNTTIAKTNNKVC